MNVRCEITAIHGLINNYRHQSKMASSKKIDQKRDFAAGVYLSEAQNPVAHTHCIGVYVQYTVLVHTRKRGMGLNQREGERGNTGEYRCQSWVENTNMTECTQEIGYLQSINLNSDKHLPQSPFTGNFC
jgi:hypothetical protein